jgi:superfamily II DNA or RNA helicase
VRKSHIVGDVVKEYVSRAYGKQFICFATDFETAGEIADKYNAVGINVAAVSAKTPTFTRNEYIRRFRDGQLMGLVNVDLFGEGFDVPAVEVVVMARPTASLAVYLQQFGRALRPLAGKAYGLVIDHVSNWKRHGFPDKRHYWTLDRRDKRAKRERDVTPPADGIFRGTAGADRFETENLAFHEKLRNGFLTLASSEPDRCVLIDAMVPKEDVAEQIWRTVSQRLDPATAPVQLEGASP